MSTILMYYRENILWHLQNYKSLIYIKTNYRLIPYKTLSYSLILIAALHFNIKSKSVLQVFPKKSNSTAL